MTEPKVLRCKVAPGLGCQPPSPLPKRPAKPARFFLLRAALCIKAALFGINRKPPVNFFLLDENIFLPQIPGKFSPQKRLYIQMRDCPLSAKRGRTRILSLSSPSHSACHCERSAAIPSHSHPRDFPSMSSPRRRGSPCSS